jgi:hypothetical protein
LIFTGVAEKFIHVKAQLIFTGVAEKCENPVDFHRSS